MAATLSLLIGRLLPIGLVALLWGLAALALPRNRRPLVASAVAWLAFACWEGVIQAITPEANLRVDPLLIGPLLTGLGIWARGRFCGAVCAEPAQPGGTIVLITLDPQDQTDATSGCMSIQFKNGQGVEQTPRGRTPKADLDANGTPATRETKA